MTQLPELFRSAGLIAVDKPAGMLVIPGRGEARGPTAQQVLEARLGTKVFVVHRLDRDTSGVLLFALDAPTHRSVSMAFEHGRVEKTYWALVLGQLATAQRIEAALVPARRGRMRVARGGEEGKPAVTLVRPLESFEGATWVEAVPLTGRTHQIRVHLSHLGHPLLVDPQYGRGERWEHPHAGAVLTRTPLHAAGVTVPGSEQTQEARITSPLPGDLAGALAALRGTG